MLRGLERAVGIGRPIKEKLMDALLWTRRSFGVRLVKKNRETSVSAYLLFIAKTCLVTSYAEGINCQRVSFSFTKGPARKRVLKMAQQKKLATNRGTRLSWYSHRSHLPVAFKKPASSAAKGTNCSPCASWIAASCLNS